ncbi:bifunctional 5,10-methylenetetrahydrofolate dehydrogenase/5,10-methenyltetrahydrofolate cyclohydrolase [Patescibacteria group bacterium]|nr:bifunctional 5,10-methylenetetrahydrofolate dehydrogenase/5,10-methenyltetrahydrofolate cyclohydrolase [Patescibacteria group bacterium]
MKLFDGKKAARKILKDLAADIKKDKIRPALAVVLVGENEASKLYVKLKKEAAVKIGVEIKEFYFGDQAKEEEIIDRIEKLNEDEKVHGIIVQLPLPAVFNTERILEIISPQKDVDGFHKENRRLLEKGETPHFLPVLPLAILTAIADAVKKNLASLKNKNILALVNSEIFGSILKLVLEKEGAPLKYQVRNTCIVLGIEKEIQAADILITVCGCPNLIKGEMIKSGVILIDGGVTRYHDGKVVGDVNRKDVKSKAAFLTPVPGGIGPLTVALLLRNVFLAAKGIVKK